MRTTTYLGIRMGVVLTFLLGMPLLALPQVHSLVRSMTNSDRNPEVADNAAQHAPSENADGNAEGPLLFVEPVLPEIAASPKTDADTLDVEELKERFIELGVERMVLERIGVEGTRYRFTCNIPLRQGSAYKKRFRVIDVDPAEAMRRVLADVERWRVAGGVKDLGRPTVRLR